MRSAFLSILATVITLSFGATSAGPWSGWNYVDTDGDGVCDYAGSMCAYVDEDGDGLCDVCDTYRWCGAHWRGAGRGCGGNYVDEDGDGICDNYTSGQSQGRGCGRGRGNCSRGRRGR